MSKRFGRNQRRKMREQIAAMEQAAKFDRALLRHQSEKIDNLDRTLRDVAHAFGPYFAPLGIKVMEVAGDPRRYVDMAMPPRYRGSYNEEGFVIENAPINQVLRLIHVFLQVERRNHCGAETLVRLLIRNRNDGEWCYAISERALERNGLDDRFIREVLAPEIARKLQHAVNDKVRRA